MKILCAIGLHKWSAWSEMIPAYSGIYQFKFCKCCNKIQKIHAGNGIDVNLSLWNHNHENN